MKRGDIFLGLALIVGLAYFFVPHFWEKDKETASGKLYARITVDGKPYQTVELTKEAKEYDIKTKYGYNILKVYNNGAQMIDADCPDKLCLTFGFVDGRGQSIVCLPHRVMVEVVDESGSGGGDIDAVSV